MDCEPVAQHARGVVLGFLRTRHYRYHAGLDNIVIITKDDYERLAYRFLMELDRELSPAMPDQPADQPAEEPADPIAEPDLVVVPEIAGAYAKPWSEDPPRQLLSTRGCTR